MYISIYTFRQVQMTIWISTLKLNVLLHSCKRRESEHGSVYKILSCQIYRTRVNIHLHILRPLLACKKGDGTMVHNLCIKSQVGNHKRRFTVCSMRNGRTHPTLMMIEHPITLRFDNQVAKCLSQNQLLQLHYHISIVIQLENKH